jgi:hypothetical protein
MAKSRGMKGIQMNTKDGTIYITKAEEDSWLISIKADADDARILRGVFTDAAREGGWSGAIVWNWDSKVSLCRASNDRAYVAMDRAAVPSTASPKICSPASIGRHPSERPHRRPQGDPPGV